MVESPEDESKSCTVPESGKEEYDYQIQVGSVFTLLVTAQRDVEIFPEPGSQRDMPSAPELGNGGRHVRVIKVFKELESKHFSQADSHIRVSGEIVIDLKRIKYRCDPYYLRRHGIRIICIDSVSRLCHGVCDDDLLTETKDKSADSFCGLFHGDRSVFQLIVNIFIPYDGARDKLGEERDIQSQVYDLLLNGELSSVEVNDVRHYLECEEGYSYWKPYAQGCYRNVEIVYKHHGSKRCILEESQQSEIEDDIKDQDELSLRSVFIESKSRKIVYDYRSKHQKNVNRLPPGIEEQAGKEQKYVNVFVFTKYSASDENNGQKYHYKYQRTKKHKSPFVMALK